MSYCENIRQMIGNSPLIIVRPSVAIINADGETKYDGEITSYHNLGKEVRFFKLNRLPEKIEPLIKNKLVELKGHIEKINPLY